MIFATEEVLLEGSGSLRDSLSHQNYASGRDSPRACLWTCTQTAPPTAHSPTRLREAGPTEWYVRFHCPQNANRSSFPRHQCITRSTPLIVGRKSSSSRRQLMIQSRVVQATFEWSVDMMPSNDLLGMPSWLRAHQPREKELHIIYTKIKIVMLGQ